MCKKQAHLDHTATKSKHIQAPDAGESPVDLEHLSHVGGTLSFHVVVVEADICRWSRCQWGADVFVQKRAHLGSDRKTRRGRT